jgi:hypothetical protein
MFKKLKQIIFKEELQLIKNLQNELLLNCNNLEEKIIDLSLRHQAAINVVSEARSQYIDATKLCNEVRKTISQLMDVGVDVHMKNTNHSWAVVCLQGKPEYVKFVHLDHSSCRELMRYLRQFESSNMTIDSPMNFKEFMKDWGI